MRKAMCFDAMEFDFNAFCDKSRRRIKNEDDGTRTSVDSVCDKVGVVNDTAKLHKRHLTLALSGALQAPRSVHFMDHAPSPAHR